MSFCYGIAWLFHFKMSPNTTMQAHRLRSGFTFSSKRQVFGYHLVNQAQMQVGRLHISQPPSIKSRALLRSVVQAYLFILHITWQILVSYSIREFRKEKINALDHYPTIVKSSSDAGGRATYFATSLHQVSSVTEVWCPGIPVSFAYYMANTW